MLYWIELAWKPSLSGVAVPPCCPSRRSRERGISRRGRLRRGGVGARPMVQNLLRKREVRRLGMGRRSPHRTSPRHNRRGQADPVCYVQSIRASPRGPPADVGRTARTASITNHAKQAAATRSSAPAHHVKRTMLGICASCRCKTLDRAFATMQVVTNGKHNMVGRRSSTGRATLFEWATEAWHGYRNVLARSGTLRTARSNHSPHQPLQLVAHGGKKPRLTVADRTSSSAGAFDFTIRDVEKEICAAVRDFEPGCHPAAAVFPTWANAVQEKVVLLPAITKRLPRERIERYDCGEFWFKGVKAVR